MVRAIGVSGEAALSYTNYRSAFSEAQEFLPGIPAWENWTAAWPEASAAAHEQS